MHVHRTKQPKNSPLFEKANLERMKKASETAQLAEELMQDAQRQIEEAHRLVQESRRLRSMVDRHGREHSAQGRHEPG